MENNTKLQHIEKMLDLFEKKVSSSSEVEESLLAEARVLVDNPNFISAIQDIYDRNKEISFDSFIDKCDFIIENSDKLQEIRDRLEYLQYLKTGNKYNFVKLKKLYEDRNIKKKFPNFNLKRYQELINNPVLELNNYLGERIKFDPFVVSKLIIAINQMVFDEMDIRIVTVGKEGSGKSCFSSQLILYCWWFMTEVGLISYEYDVKTLFFGSVEKLLEEHDKQKENDYGRIFCLDEGYELNRSNYRDEGSRFYKDSMRSERKMLRLEFINLPQLGELELAITQTRTNFIFEAFLGSNLETSTLRKGMMNFYIIPRGNTIYSRYLRKELTAAEVVNQLSAVLKDKNDSYKGLPGSIIIHKFYFSNVWGFDKSIYDSFIKKENKERRSKSQVKITDYIAYLIYKKLPQTKHLGMFDKSNKGEVTMYKHWQKFRESIRLRFETNPDLLFKYERMEKLKVENGDDESD